MAEGGQECGGVGGVLAGCCQGKKLVCGWCVLLLCEVFQSGCRTGLHGFSVQDIMVALRHVFLSC